MSLPTISGTAKLLGEPKKSLTSANQPMATVVVKFSSWRKVDDAWVEGDGVVALVSAFDDVARTLVEFAKGDEVTLDGRATLGIWQDKPQLKIALANCRAAEPRRSSQPVPA